MSKQITIVENKIINPITKNEHNIVDKIKNSIKTVIGTSIKSIKTEENKTVKNRSINSFVPIESINVPIESNNINEIYLPIIFGSLLLILILSK